MVTETCTQPLTQEENPLKAELRALRSQLQDFKVLPWHSPEGDTLTVMFSPERCYSERQDGLLTIYFSEKTHELVGCKIKGVSILAENVETTFSIYREQRCELRFILLAASGTSPKREYMYELARKAEGITVDLRTLRLAA